MEDPGPSVPQTEEVEGMSPSRLKKVLYVFPPRVSSSGKSVLNRGVLICNFDVYRSGLLISFYNVNRFLDFIISKEVFAFKHLSSDPTTLSQQKRVT